MSTTLTPSIVATADQIHQTKQAIDAYIHSLDANPHHREGAYPYYLFHEPDQPIRGTVMIFHGFSARPHQMWRLADYLFQNGFNVYQCALAGHTLVPPAQFWPQIDLLPDIADPLKAKIDKDPVLKNFFTNLASNPEGYDRPSYQQQAALLARLLMIEPRLLNIVNAIQNNNDNDFKRYYISSHMNYLDDAVDRFNELSAMPGPIYTVGLSVGGAVALGLAAAKPERIKRVVAYAPLLQVYGAERRKYVELAGPLDINELGWDPNLRFPVGALTAADRFGGAYVLSRDSMKNLKQIPVFLTLTENEDAADIETSQKFFANLGGERQGHRYYFYKAEDLVPHPMVDPTETSQGMSNRFWQSLYQETFRFLTTGDVDQQNMNNLDQVPELPQVPPV